MTDNRYNELNKNLGMLRDALIEEVRQKRQAIAEARTPDQSSISGDSSDQAFKLSNEDVEVALINMKTEELNQINGALRRLEEGNYGNCEDCGEEISEIRLKRRPFATKCLRCKEAEEAVTAFERKRAGQRPLFIVG